MKKILMVLGILLPAVGANAATDYDLLLNNTAHEYTICTAFFIVAKNALKTNPNVTPELLSQTDEYITASMNLSFTYGKEVGVSAAGFEARLEDSMNEMISDMDGNFSNFSVIMVKHRDRCANMVQDPQSVLMNIFKKSTGN